MEGGRRYVSTSPVYRLVLRREMHDCLLIDEYLSNTNLNLKGLTRLYLKYYQCKGVGFEDFRIKDPIQLRVGLLAGPMAAQGKITGVGYSYYWADQLKSDWSTSFTGSLILEFSKKERERVRVKTGLTYYDNRFHFEAK